MSGVIGLLADNHETTFDVLSFANYMFPSFKSYDASGKDLNPNTMMNVSGQLGKTNRLHSF